MAFEMSVMPWSTLSIMAISILIAFVNSGLNRFLVSRLVGWDSYRTMQKEMAEYRSQQMAAARAGDKKQLEKLKKKESQIMNMQTKMAKPQMLLLGISFIYIIVWIFVLTPSFGSSPVAYLPGFSQFLGNDLGQISVFYWYPICSLFFGTLASRILGIMPME
jgi:uncharacterized membrane protein (DUF106 family)